MKLSLLGNIIDFLFPRYCAICDQRLLGTEEMLCATCLQDLPISPTWETPYETIWLRCFLGAHSYRKMRRPLLLSQPLQSKLHHLQTEIPSSSRYRKLSGKTHRRARYRIRLLQGYRCHHPYPHHEVKKEDPRL